jgi:phosphoribosyl 1,2-cyclic phosphodiesterase
MNTGDAMPLYVRSEDVPILEKSHFYLLDKSIRMSGGGVADIDLIETGLNPFDVAGVRFVPLPVEHGPGFSTNGYRIGDVCYMPDVSKIPDSTARLMRNCDVLILDALRRGRTHGSHLTLEQAIDVVRDLRPRRAIFTDMTHDIVHDSTNAELAALKEPEGLDIELAYDGLWFESEVP